MDKHSVPNIQFRFGSMSRRSLDLIRMDHETTNPMMMKKMKMMMMMKKMMMMMMQIHLLMNRPIDVVVDAVADDMVHVDIGDEYVDDRNWVD